MFKFKIYKASTDTFTESSQRGSNKYRKYTRIINQLIRRIRMS